MPLTLPRQVSPEYGTLIESVPIEAVPAIVMAQEVRPGPVALPFALQLIATGDVNVPSAVPVNFRSPGQLALKDPFAAVDCLLGDVPLEVRAGARRRDQGRRRPASNQRVVARGRGFGEGALTFEGGASNGGRRGYRHDDQQNPILHWLYPVRLGLHNPWSSGFGPAPLSDHLIWLSGTRRPHNSAGRARIIPPHPRAIARESAAELGNL